MAGWRRLRGAFLPKQIAVRLKLPFLGEISGTWEPGLAERDAAWELYIELITRVSVVDLGPDEGLVREALSSLYTLFGTTREDRRFDVTAGLILRRFTWRGLAPVVRVIHTESDSTIPIYDFRRTRVEFALSREF